MSECKLCCEDKELLTVGVCEHPYVCLDCTYKCRVITKNNKCTFCNQELLKVAVVESPEQTFSSLTLLSTEEFKNGIFWTSQKTRGKCLALEAKMCPVPNCKKSFGEINALKKHLLDAHKRKFCEICLGGQALLLSEQRIFRFGDLEDHMQKGDIDEDNNVVMFHPFCKFCERYFFNEEQFTAHLKIDHLRCNICPPAETKFVYYANPLTLRTHYVKTHFACNYTECVERPGTVFKTKDELENHFGKVHLKQGGNKKVMIPASAPVEAKFELKDSEGVDVLPQVS